MRRLRIAGVVTTFITGTITTAMVSLARKRDSGPAGEAAELKSPAVLAAMFLVYAVAAGATVGLVLSHIAYAVAFAPAAILSALTFRAMVRPPEQDRESDDE